MTLIVGQPFTVRMGHASSGPRRSFTESRLVVPNRAGADPLLLSAQQVMSGFQVGYTHGGRDLCELSASIPRIRTSSSPVVDRDGNRSHSYEAIAEAGLRDSQSNFDDSYFGIVRGVLFGLTPSDEEGSIELVTLEIAFSHRSGSAHAGNASFSITSRELRREDVAVLLSGFEVGYDKGHHLRDLNVNLVIQDVVRTGAGQYQVNIQGELELRDSSSNFDDPFGGVIRGVLIARTS